MNDGQQVGEPSAVLGTAVITYMCTCIRARMYVYNKYVCRSWARTPFCLDMRRPRLQPVWVGTVAWVPLDLFCLARPMLVGPVPTRDIQLHTTDVGC